VNGKIMYCVKCRAKREGKDVKEVTMKNGKLALQAVCEVCGTKMFKIKGNKK
jgi:RNase P subunit RPR2